MAKLSKQLRHLKCYSSSPECGADTKPPSISLKSKKKQNKKHAVIMSAILDLFVFPINVNTLLKVSDGYHKCSKPLQQYVPLYSMTPVLVEGWPLRILMDTICSWEESHQRVAWTCARMMDRWDINTIKKSFTRKIGIRFWNYTFVYKKKLVIK